jgi:hypothetical protein
MVMNQKTLFGTTLENPQTKEELSEVCCEACYNAKEPECTCQCHGAFHGLGNRNKNAAAQLPASKGKEKVSL